MTYSFYQSSFIDSEKMRDFLRNWHEGRLGSKIEVGLLLGHLTTQRHGLGLVVSLEGFRFRIGWSVKEVGTDFGISS